MKDLPKLTKEKDLFCSKIIQNKLFDGTNVNDCKKNSYLKLITMIFLLVIP